jgi:hypothetical protein
MEDDEPDISSSKTNEVGVEEASDGGGVGEETIGVSTLAEAVAEDEVVVEEETSVLLLLVVGVEKTWFSKFNNCSIKLKLGETHLLLDLTYS